MDESEFTAILHRLDSMTARQHRRLASAMRRASKLCEPDALGLGALADAIGRALMRAPDRKLPLQKLARAVKNFGNVQAVIDEVNFGAQLGWFSAEEVRNPRWRSPLESQRRGYKEPARIWIVTVTDAAAIRLSGENS